MTEFIAYYRVSTQRQGTSGLGLEAQRTAVAAFVLTSRGKIVCEFIEIESGADSSRPKLQEAVALAKQRKATLVIAKLDRLARSVHFISSLMESRVDFVAADMPHANKLTIHLIAAVGEYEREMISARTKAALRSAKARGVVLGNPNAPKQAKAASEVAKRMADEFARAMVPDISTLAAQGVSSLTEVAAALNARGCKTQRGRQWTAAGVSNLKKRVRRLLANSAA